MMKPMLFSGLSDIPNILNPDQGYYSGKAVQREWAGYQKSNPMNKISIADEGWRQSGEKFIIIDGIIRRRRNIPSIMMNFSPDCRHPSSAIEILFIGFDF